MASSKELKAIISIAGTIDPSLSKAINQATKMTGGLGTALRVADGVFKVGGAAITAASGAAVAFGKTAVDSAIDYETAFTGVMKTVEETGTTTYDMLSDSIKQMATETASNQKDIAGVMESAGQLGISADEITDFTKTMVMLGDTTNVTAEEAAVSLAHFTNITGESNQNIDRLGASIVDLGNNFATDEASIIAMSTRLASAGTLAGLTSTDILALSTAMSSVGIEAEAGGTAMSQTLAQISKSVELAGTSVDSTGKWSDKLQTMAEVAGMSADEFKKAWGEDAVSTLSTFIEGLSNAEENGRSANVVLDELGMTGLRQSNMLQSLSLASDVLAEAVETSNNAYQENTALIEEANKRYGTTESKIQQMKNAFTNLQLEVSQVFMPAFKDFVQFGTDGISQITEAFQNDGISGAMDALGQFLADGLVMIADALPQFVDMGIQLLGALGQGILANMDVIIDAAVQIAESAFNAVIVALPALMDGIMQVIVSVLTDTLGPEVGEAVQSIYDNITELGGQIIDIVGEIGSTIMPIITDIIQAVLPFISQLIDALMPGIQSTLEALEPAISALLTALQPVIDAALNALPPIIDLIGTIISALSVELSPMLEMITGLIEAILPVITEVVSYWIEEIGLISQFVSDVFRGDWEAAWLDIQNIFSTAWESMQGIFSAAVEALSTIGQSLLDFFTTMWSNVTEAWSTGIATLGELVVSALTPVVQSILDTFTTLKENVGLAFEGLKEAILNSQLAETVRTIIDEIRLIFEGILSWLQDTFIGTWTTIWETVKNVFKTIWESLAGIVKSVFNAVIGLINKVIGAINNIHVNVPGPLQGIVGMASWGPHIDELPMLARGGFTKGASIAGEAGTEAVISFDSSVRRENLSYWAKAGKLLGVNATAVDTLAASAKDRSSSTGNSIVFSPNVTIEGNADYDMVLQALRDNEEEFMDMVQEFFGNKMRVSYG